LFDEDIVKSTVDAATQGDLRSLDMKSLLGEALSSLTEQLGIDVSSELTGSDTAKADIQVLLATVFVCLLQARAMNYCIESYGHLYQFHHFYRWDTVIDCSLF
jgi:hypothetical protein